jgi:Fe-S-cluster containining protein
VGKAGGKAWWQEGVRFQCQGSGKCCVSRGAVGYVYLTLEDRRRLAGALGLGTAAFTRRYCERVDDQWRLRDGGPDCTFLQDRRCGVYEARPTQCRTWPFWPENMAPKAWAAVAAFCPGVGQGAVVPAARIAATLAEQRESTAKL